MAFFPIEGYIGSQPINVSDTTQRHPLGFQLDALDPVSYGGGRFIYLKGVASTVVGSVVTWDAAAAVPTYQTALNGAVANGNQQFAVAQAATVAGQFGWYQIAGTGPVATNGTLAAAGQVYQIAGGQVTSTVVATKAVNNMKALTATGTPSAGLAVCQFDHPAGEGIVT